MATVSATFNFSITVPQTDGGGTSYTQTLAKYLETITLTDANGLRAYPATAGETGINIFPPSFAAGDQILVLRRQDATASDANIGQFVVKRNDGTIVHEMPSWIGFASFAMEAADTALTIDNLDSTNAQTYFVGVYRPG